MVMVIYILKKKNFISAYSLEHLSSLTPVQRRPSLHSNFVWVTGKCSLPLLLQSKDCLLGLLETSSNASRVDPFHSLFSIGVLQYKESSASETSLWNEKFPDFLQVFSHLFKWVPFLRDLKVSYINETLSFLDFSLFGLCFVSKSLGYWISVIGL